MDIKTLDRDTADRVRSEEGNAMLAVGTRVHDAMLAAMDSLVMHRLELAMRSANVSSGRDTRIVVLDPDQRDFSGNSEGLQMTQVS